MYVDANTSLIVVSQFESGKCLDKTKLIKIYVQISMALAEIIKSVYIPVRAKLQQKQTWQLVFRENCGPDLLDLEDGLIHLKCWQINSELILKF